MPQTMRFHDEFSTYVLPVFTHIPFSIHYSLMKEIRTGIILIFLLSLLILPRLILLNPLCFRIMLPGLFQFRNNFKAMNHLDMWQSFSETESALAVQRTQDTE
jgi:hypothetical protein